eukprot:TRINITY_DN2818_c0_g1_i1.p1 TRINITY_DN2818_c0_g1~~TRINITY_DN2818_c0_g1_i1.p1  ORF type:complete len:1917 (-),score=337.73 TRINITY_DN2818_c0_g1_i1:419-6169(-)
MWPLCFPSLSIRKKRGRIRQENCTKEEVGENEQGIAGESFLRSWSGMERNRENRRGSLAISGSASRRKPRSSNSSGVFKDCTEDEEGLNESHDSGRLRERSGSSGKRSSLSSSRNKRKRPGQFDRFQRERDRDHDVGGVDSSDESVGDEEDSDEPPPPLPPPLPQRKVAKLRSTWKGGDDLILAGPRIMVPRRARSASLKRSHDSASVSAPAGSDGHQQHQHRQRKSPSPVRPLVPPASPSSSNASVKQQPSKKVKLIGGKRRPSKVAKVSSSISQRELEVAEALYGLTRQFHSHHQHNLSEGYGNNNASTSKSDANVKEELSSAPPGISKVLSSSSVVSSSLSPPPSSSSILHQQQQQQHSTLTSTPAMGTAPKRKRPRPTKPEESTMSMRPPLGHPGAISGNPVVTGASRNEAEQRTLLTKAEAFSSLKSESNNASSFGKGTVPVSSAMSATNSNQVQSPLRSNQTDAASMASEKLTANRLPDPKQSPNAMVSEVKPSDLKINGPKTEDPKIEESNLPSERRYEDPKNAQTTEGPQIRETIPAASSPETKPSQSSLIAEDTHKMVSQVETSPLDKPRSDLPSAADFTRESSKMGLPSIKTEHPLEAKFEIDLMAPPVKSPLDLEDETGHVAITSDVDAVAEDTRNAKKTDAFATAEVKVELTGLEEKDMAKETTVEQETKGGGEETELENPAVKDSNIDPEKGGDVREKPGDAAVEKRSRMANIDPVVEKADLNGTGVTANTSNASAATSSMPMPVTVANWPGGLHSLGYFGATAASWPAIQLVAMDRANRTPVMQPAYIMPKPQKALKRCAMHSYIAHFIAYQQQMSRHPFWPSNYGNSLALFGGKAYNLNMPVPPPPTELMSLTGTLQDSMPVSGAPKSSSSNAGSNIDALPDRNASPPSLAFNNQPVSGMSSNVPLDVRKKQNPQQQPVQQADSTITQQGLPNFRFLNSQTAAGTAMTGIASNAGNPTVSGKAAVLGSAHMEGPSGSLAAIGAEYLTMFPNIHPFALSPLSPHGHFGAGYNGTSNHAGQQPGPQFFSNPFYTTQIMATQIQPPSQPQQQTTQHTTTSSGSSSSQKHQQHVQDSRTSQKHQKQQGINSPAATNLQHSHQHMPASQSRQTERDNGADSSSTADSRVSLKPFYGQASSNSSSLFPVAVPLQSQDFALISALGGGKQNAKPQPQTQHTQGTAQLQHQVVPSYVFQQHQGNESSFQMKALDFSQTQAQAIAALSRGPGLMGAFPAVAQGHATLQGLTESASHQLAAQMQRSGLTQRSQTTSSGDGRGREDECKNAIKSGHGSSLSFSRTENENSANMQGSPVDGILSGSSASIGADNNMGRALNIASSHGNRNALQNGSYAPACGSSQPSSSQMLNQYMKQPIGRAKNQAHTNSVTTANSQQAGTSSPFVDRTMGSSLKQQVSPAPLPGQSMKAGHQTSSAQWKVSSAAATTAGQLSHAVGSPPQSFYSSTVKHFPQQNRNAQASANILVSAQQPSNHHNNGCPGVVPRLSAANVTAAPAFNSLPSSPQASASKSVSNSMLKTSTPKGPVSQQKTAASSSTKKSSPVSGRSSSPSVLSPTQISQSSTPGKQAQPQLVQTSQASTVHSGLSPGLKSQGQGQGQGQPYASQVHFSQQPQLLFSPNQFIQQQMAHQLSLQYQGNGYGQKQIHGSNSPQMSFSIHQQQQMLPTSLSSNTGPLSIGSPTLTLGGSSSGTTKGNSASPNNKGNALSYAQYSGKQQPSNFHGSLPSHLFHASATASAKPTDQKSTTASDVLNQDHINSLRLLQNSANKGSPAVQGRTSLNSASSPSGSSARSSPSTCAKKAGVNMTECLNSPAGLTLSVAPSSARTSNSGLASGLSALQQSKSSSAGPGSRHPSQTSSIPAQASVPLAAIGGSSATSTNSALHSQAAASVVQP